MAKNTKSLGIIPARFSSVRFPGKPLADIAGKTMIRRVYEQASKSKLDAIIVATDDERIFRHVTEFGGHAEMTSPMHRSGTDRCAEVAALPAHAGYEIIVNIQGDEPFIEPELIDAALEFLSINQHFSIVTFSVKIDTAEAIFNANVVKTVFDQQQRALYFSRSPIPYLQHVPTEHWLQKSDFFKHIGLYAFRRESLLAITTLPPGKLEVAESLEQLRWLENGIKIGIILTESESFGIDTPADLDKLRLKLEQQASGF